MALSGILLERMDGELTSEQEKQVHMIEKGGHQLHELIITLLDLSKIEAGKIEFNFEPFDLEVAVQSAIATVMPLLKNSQSSLSVDIKQGPLRLVSDRGKVEQIWLNLLSNAVKFIPEGGTILIGAELDSDKKHISCFIKDNGIGISKNDQAFIFEKFRTVGSPFKQKHGGTGLGLSITKKLVQILGGRIWVESELGRGAKFVFTLPLKPSGLTEDSDDHYDYPDLREPQDVSEIDPLKRTVLVVENDENTLRVLTSFLKREGCEVITAKNGYEALQKAKKFNPFAVTLSALLPGMDGWQVLHELREDIRTEQIPVIVVSKLGSKELGLSLGRVDYLVKPIDQYRLVRRVKKLLGNSTKKDILIVDDEYTELNLLTKVLEAHSYNVLATSGGPNAVQLHKMYKPDLVILNLLSLNDLCWDIVLEIKRERRKKQIPILIIIKNLTKAERESATECFLRTFSKEPIMQEEALQEVHALLDRRRTER